MNIIDAWLEATQTAEELEKRISERAGEFYKEQSGRTSFHALQPWWADDESLHCTTDIREGVINVEVPVSWFGELTAETYEPFVNWCKTHRSSGSSCYYAGGRIEPCDFEVLYVKR